MENSSQHSNVSEVFKVSMSVKDLMQTENGALVIVDTGAPSSMCGLDWFKKLFQSMPKAIRSQLVVENSTTKFEFGGGERRESLGLVTLPVYVMDDDYQAHMIFIKVEIVEADICMLFGGSSLDIAEATMTLGAEPTLTLPSVLGPGTRIPMQKSKTGHYTFYLFPPTDVDDRDVAAQMLDTKEWTEEKAKSAISYIVQNENPNYEAVFHDHILLSKSFQKDIRRKKIKILEGKKLSNFITTLDTVQLSDLRSY